MFGVVHKGISLLAPPSKLSSCTVTVLPSVTIDFAPKTDTRNGRLSASRPSTSATSSFKYDEPEPPSRKALALILTPFFSLQDHGYHLQGYSARATHTSAFVNHSTGGIGCRCSSRWSPFHIDSGGVKCLG